MSTRKRKKVGIIANEFLPHFGGMESYAQNLALALREGGFDVHVFTRMDAGDLDGVVCHKELTGELFHDIPALDRYEMDAWFAINVAYLMLAVRKPHVYAFIHGNDFLNPWVRYRLPWLQHKFIWRYKDVIEQRFLRHKLKRAIHHAAGIFSNSSFTKRKFVLLYPGAAKKTTIVNPGVDASIITEPQPRQRHYPVRFMTVARLTKTNARKNILNVISALKQIRDTHECAYYVVGDGDDRDHLEEVTRQMGMQDRVVFTGRVSPQELADLYRETDLFILVSKNTNIDIEGFGIVYIEANACGVPVLAGRSSGSEDAVKEGVSGFFSNGEDSQDIARAVLTFLNNEVSFDPNLLVEHARQFTWDKVTQRILAAIPDLG